LYIYWTTTTVLLYISCFMFIYPAPVIFEQHKCINCMFSRFLVSHWHYIIFVITSVRCETLEISQNDVTTCEALCGCLAMLVWHGNFIGFFYSMIYLMLQHENITNTLSLDRKQSFFQWVKKEYSTRYRLEISEKPHIATWS
jgi:hypothetical protein